MQTMEMPPFYWTLIAEIAIVLIGVLIAVIVVVLKDRSKLKDYTDNLKKIVQKLKQKLLEKDNEQSQERILELLNALIDHVHEQYLALYGSEIKVTENDDSPSVEKFILIAGYQIMIAARAALENSNEPDAAWEKIKNEITPLIENYLSPALSAPSLLADSPDEGADNLQAELENAHQRIANLEKFKQLYFDLQDRLVSSVEEIENLNQQIAEIVEGDDNFANIRAIIEKNKTQYIHMGQMIGMDKEHHHESVLAKMDYSAELISERKDEIKRLKQQISQQFEEIWGLQSRLSNPSGVTPDSAQLSAGIETMSRQLKDSEMCIETMDMEIQTLSSEIANLQNKLQQQEAGSVSGSGLVELEEKVLKKDQIIARFTQESNELMSCITGLENNIDEQSDSIKALTNKLEKSKIVAEKHQQLEMAYADMEEKYLQAMSK